MAERGSKFSKSTSGPDNRERGWAIKTASLTFSAPGDWAATLTRVVEGHHVRPTWNSHTKGLLLPHKAQAVLEVVTGDSIYDLLATYFKSMNGHRSQIVVRAGGKLVNFGDEKNPSYEMEGGTSVEIDPLRREKAIIGGLSFRCEVNKRTY